MAAANGLLFNIASFISGLFLLEYSADKFIDHTAIVAKRLNVSPTLVGLLTCGAEWEELVVILVSLSQKNSTMALGNLMGSSIANILGSFSLGLVFIGSATFDRSSKIYATALMVLTSVFMLFLYTLNAAMKRVVGALLIALFGVYIASVASLIYRGTLTPPEDDSDDDSDSSSDSDGQHSDSSDSGFSDGEHRRQTHASSSLAPKNHLLRSLKARDSKGPRQQRSSPQIKLVRSRTPRQNRSITFHVMQLLVGFAALVVSSYVIANSASMIGLEAGLSGTVVGTTILSIATTLPEKFVAVIGGVRKQPGIMVANTVGSNIFLVTLCAGVLFLSGDAEQLDLGFTLFEASAMWISSATILAIVWNGGSRWMGVVLLGFYITFLLVEFLSGRSLDDD